MTNDGFTMGRILLQEVEEPLDRLLVVLVSLTLNDHLRHVQSTIQESERCSD